MHAKVRIPSSSGHNSPSRSPPQSPLSRSPRVRRRQGRFTPSSGQSAGLRNRAEKAAWGILSLLLRRQGFFLFAPLLYISGMLFNMGTVSFDVVPVIHHRSRPGSVYRSPQLFAKLKSEIQSDNSSVDAEYWASAGCAVICSNTEINENPSSTVSIEVVVMSGGRSHGLSKEVEALVPLIEQGIEDLKTGKLVLTGKEDILVRATRKQDHFGRW